MKIEYNRSVTINLGNFNSKRIELGIEDEVQEGETQEDCYERLKAFVNLNLRKEYEEAKK